MTVRGGLIIHESANQIGKFGVSVFRSGGVELGKAPIVG